MKTNWQKSHTRTIDPSRPVTFRKKNNHIAEGVVERVGVVADAVHDGENDGLRTGHRSSLSQGLPGLPQPFWARPALLLI